MSTELTLFDYGAVPADVASDLRAAAERIRVRMKRTAEDIVEIGRDLIAAKARCGHGKFGAWIDAEFGMSDSSAQNFMNVSSRFGDKFPNFGNIGSSVLQLLAAPSTPDAVIDQAVAKSEAGERVTVALVEQLKREAAAAKAQAEKVQKDLFDLKSKSEAGAAAASRREANLIADKERALADKAAAEARIATEAERATEAAWAEADEKYETTVNRLNRERDEAKRQLKERTEEATRAIERAKAEAERQAKAEAELLAAQAVDARKAELAELERACRLAQENCKRAYAQEQRAKSEMKTAEEMVAQHRDEMARWQSGEAETADQIKLAKDFMKAIGDAMHELTVLEHGPQDAACPHLRKAGQMARQMADAIDAFLAVPGISQVRP